MIDSLKHYLATKESVCGFHVDYDPRYVFNRTEKIGNGLLTPLCKVFKKIEDTKWKIIKIALFIVGIVAVPFAILGAIFKRLGECFNSQSIARKKNIAMLFEAKRVFSLDLIYNPKSYTYSIPRSTLETYLSGKVSEKSKNYTSHEIENLYLDMYEIYQNILKSSPDKKKIAILTAGGRGAGKTTKLKQQIEVNKQQNKNFAHVCPEDVRKNLNRTYKSDVEHTNSSIESRIKVKNKWLSAVHATSHLILANLIRTGSAICAGTGMSDPSAKTFFEFLKKQGYSIKLIHVTAPTEVCLESIKNRDKKELRTDEEGIQMIAQAVSKRMKDTYLAFADEIEFYYRGAVYENSILAATWKKVGDKRDFQISEPTQFQKIKAIHRSLLEG